jgi:alkyl hydroperoxide reductase subunit AhpF
MDISSRGYIKVDEYQNTSVPNVFALGDVCGNVELTPVAVSAGTTKCLISAFSLLSVDCVFPLGDSVRSALCVTCVCLLVCAS